MKSYFKINLLLLIGLVICIESISATPIHYDHDPMANMPTTIIQKTPIKKAKKQKGKWFRSLFKKKKQTSKKRSTKQLKRAKRKLLWTWFKNQFKPKKKDKGTGSHLEFWSMASFIMGLLALLTFIASIALTEFFIAAGSITALIFYLLLGSTAYLFAEWGQRNIDLYPDYYTGRSLTKWAKGMILFPVILFAVAFLVFLLEF